MIASAKLCACGRGVSEWSESRECSCGARRPAADGARSSARAWPPMATASSAPTAAGWVLRGCTTGARGVHRTRDQIAAFGWTASSGKAGTCTPLPPRSSFHAVEFLLYYRGSRAPRWAVDHLHLHRRRRVGRVGRGRRPGRRTPTPAARGTRRARAPPSAFVDGAPLGGGMPQPSARPCRPAARRCCRQRPRSCRRPSARWRRPCCCTRRP